MDALTLERPSRGAIGAAPPPCRRTIYMIGHRRGICLADLGRLSAELRGAYDLAEDTAPDPERDRCAIASSSLVLVCYWRGFSGSDGMRAEFAVACGIPVHVVDASWDGLPSWLASRCAFRHDSLLAAARFLLADRP